MGRLLIINLACPVHTRVRVNHRRHFPLFVWGERRRIWTCDRSDAAAQSYTGPHFLRLGATSLAFLLVASCAALPPLFSPPLFSLHLHTVLHRSESFTLLIIFFIVSRLRTVSPLQSRVLCALLPEDLTTTHWWRFWTE